MTITRLFHIEDLLKGVEEPCPIAQETIDGITFVEEVGTSRCDGLKGNGARVKYAFIFSTLDDNKLWKAVYSKNALDGTDIFFDDYQGSNDAVKCVQVEAYQKTITAYREI